MDVFLNGRFLTQAVTGVQRHARSLILAIDSLLDRDEIRSSFGSWTILIPPQPSDSLEVRHIRVRRVGRLRGQLWEQLELSNYSRAGVLVSLCNVGPLRHPRHVLTIHDASVFAIPRVYSPMFGAWYRFLLPRLAHRVARIVTDSRFSARELISYLGVESEKVEIVPLGSEHVSAVKPDATVFERANIGTRPYVLAVGSGGPHKNLGMARQAIEYLDRDDIILLLAGGTARHVFGDRRVSTVHPRVRDLGYVTDGQLRALYENAACLVQPSLYEGFGLPPLEAMACGCPVVASRAASLPEVCGDAAIYCDPHDPRDIARCIQEVLEPTLSKDLRARGARRAKQFTWRGAALETVALLKRLSVTASQMPSLPNT